MRSTLPLSCGLALLLLLAVAQGQGKPLPAPSSAVVPPIELSIGLEDGKPVCEPKELRVPANTDIVIHVVSRSERPVTLTIPGQFANGLVEHVDGDLVHVASEDGFLVKQNGKGTLRLRTLAPGRDDYACTSTSNASAPVKGTYIRLEPAN